MNLPSREECEGWSQQQVASFMFRNKMPDCGLVVNRLNMNGRRLLNLSDSDINKFSLMHRPQLQKIVQDIKKNDGSLLDKLKRLKNKPVPKVPVRDYTTSENREDDELSDPDYDNDLYEEPHGDDSYEPPPSHREFTPTPPASYPRGEYLDGCSLRPSRPPKKPLRPPKTSRQLPPEPPQNDTDEEDYINPDCGNEDDNYIEPSGDPPPNHVMHCGSPVGRDRSMLAPPSPERATSPDFYEVPDTERNSMSLPVSRLSPIPPPHSQSLPPIPSPRQNVRRSQVLEPEEDAEYEVCDPADSEGSRAADRPPLPKPLPRERSPKPVLKPKPDLKLLEFDSRTLPATPTEQKPPQRSFTLDLKLPKVLPAPPSSPRPPEVGVSVPPETEQDKDVYQKLWFADSCDRKTADDVLTLCNKDGAFLVRRSSGLDSQQPFTLVVFYNERVYNIPIRFIPSMHQYALGREKRGEEHFSSVSQIIEHHQRVPLVLIDGQSNTKDATRLSHPVRP